MTMISHKRPKNRVIFNKISHPAKGLRSDYKFGNRNKISHRIAKIFQLDIINKLNVIHFLKLRFCETAKW